MLRAVCWGAIALVMLAGCTGDALIGNRAAYPSCYEATVYGGRFVDKGSQPCRFPQPSSASRSSRS